MQGNGTKSKTEVEGLIGIPVPITVFSKKIIFYFCTVYSVFAVVPETELPDY